MTVKHSQATSLFDRESTSELREILKTHAEISQKLLTQEPESTPSAENDVIEGGQSE